MHDLKRWWESHGRALFFLHERCFLVRACSGRAIREAARKRAKAAVLQGLAWKKPSLRFHAALPDTGAAAGTGPTAALVDFGFGFGLEVGFGSGFGMGRGGMGWDLGLDLD